MSAPAYAERFSIHDVFKVKRRPSKFVPNVERTETVLECPACHAEHPVEFDTTIRCKCGLSMRCSFGTALIWRDEPTEARAELITHLATKRAAS